MTKDRERQILRCVYDEADYDSVIPTERPDFILSRRSDGGRFGVEITELFRSDSQARLARIPGYLGQLLAGGDYRHKSDSNALHIRTGHILEDGGLISGHVPGVLQKNPTLPEFRELLGCVIERKGSKRHEYVQNFEYTDLVVRDRIQLFGGPPQTFFRGALDESIRLTLVESGFREVFVVTRLGDSLRRVPLIAASVASEWLMFEAALAEVRDEGLTASDSDLELFAHFLQRRGFTAAVSYAIGTCEVVTGASGLRIRGDSDVGFQIGRDFIPPDCRAPEHLDATSVCLLGAAIQVHGKLLAVRRACPPVLLDALSEDPDGSGSLYLGLAPD